MFTCAITFDSAAMYLLKLLQALSQWGQQWRVAVAAARLLSWPERWMDRKGGHPPAQAAAGPLAVAAAVAVAVVVARLMSGPNN